MPRTSTKRKPELIAPPKKRAKRKATQPPAKAARKLHIVSKTDTPAATPAPTELAATGPAAHLSPLFKKQAETNDAQIDKTLEIIGKGWVRLGKLFSVNKANGFHVALGYASFPDYAEHKTGKSKTQVYEAMRIVNELSAGTTPAVSEEDLGAMTQENAKALVALKKEGIRLTPKIISQAKDLSAKDFASKVVHPASPTSAHKDAASKGMSLAGASETRIHLGYNVTAETAAMMNNAAEIARYIARDGDRNQRFEDTFLQSMCFEYFSAHQAEYDAAKAEEGAQGVHNAINADAGLPPEPPDEDDEDLLDAEEEEGETEEDHVRDFNPDKKDDAQNAGL